MATVTVTPGYNWVSGEVVTPAKMNLAAAPTASLSAIVNADVADGAAIAASKLGAGALPEAVTVASANLVDGTIVDADINATAAIAGSKLADAGITAAKLDGAQTGSAPIYGCRAWVNFDGATADNLAGTYSRTGTEVTIAATAHGLIVGNVVRLDFTAGSPTAAVDGTYTVTQVDDANTFRVTTAATGTSSGGTVEILRRLIRGAGNVSNVTWLGATGDYVINFATAMPNANYAVSVGGSFYASYVSIPTSGNATAQAFYMNTYGSTAAPSNSAVIMCSIFA